MSSDGKLTKELADSIGEIYEAVYTAEENGLFSRVSDISVQTIFQNLSNARASLAITPPNVSQCRYPIDEAERLYLLAVNSKGLRTWRIMNVYGLHAWGILMFYLVLVTMTYFFLLECSTITGLCTIKTKSARA